MINSKEQQLIRLSDVPKLKWLPRRRGGKRLNVATVFRWAQRGLKGVKLKTVSAGGAKCTTETDIRDFFAELSDRTSAEPRRATRASHNRKEARDEQTLNEAGI